MIQRSDTDTHSKGARVTSLPSNIDPVPFVARLWHPSDGQKCDNLVIFLTLSNANATPGFGRPDHKLPPLYRIGCVQTTIAYGAIYILLPI